MVIILMIKILSICWFILIILFSSDKVSGKCREYMIIKNTKLTWSIKSILNQTVEFYYNLINIGYKFLTIILITI